MKIICLVKFVQVEETKRNSVQKRIVINPDDNAALEVALQYKDQNPETEIKIVTMGPKTCTPHIEQQLRKGVDYGVLITDRAFAGSDTYATSLVISEYLKTQSYDLILTGNKTVDGDTGQVPGQVAQLLKIPQVSFVDKLEISSKAVKCEVKFETMAVTLSYHQPLIISCNKQVVKRTRFVKVKERGLDVSDRMLIVNNHDLDIDCRLVGLRNSPTRVVKVTNNNQPKDEHHQVCMEVSIEEVAQIIETVKES